MKRGARQDGGCRKLPMAPTPEPNDDSPGVPGFRTWRSVYWFVLGCFVLVVLALTLFSRFYA